MTEHEARIAAEVSAEWSAILGSAPAHSGQSFFELGGSSLAAARLASRLSALYGVAMPFRAVVEAPSVAGLVAWLRDNQVSGRGRLLALSPGEAADPLVVFPDEQGDPAQLRSAISGFQRPVLGVRSRGLQGVGEPLLSLQDMAEDWVRMFAVWSPSRTVYLAGVGVGCAFAAAGAHALAAEGWSIPAVVLVNPVTPAPTSFDAAIADRIRSLARSLGLAAGTEPNPLESLRDALGSAGRNVSDAVFDEMVVRLRVAAANAVAASEGVRYDGLQRLLVLSQEDGRALDASPDWAVKRTLGVDGTIRECVEAWIADVEGDRLSSGRPLGK